MPTCNIHVFADNSFKSYEDEIGREQLKKLVNGKANLIRFLELFELYEQLLDAHIETKSVFYKLNIESTLKAEDHAQYFHTTRNELNRRLFNTLNLGKLYLDKHFFQNTNTSFVFKVTQNSDKHHKVQEHREFLFKSNIHYMIGCELRRFSQHVSIMTRVISRGIKFDPDSGGLTSTLNASISREELRGQVGLSQEKLERTPEKIDLHDTLDGYIDAISAMHFVNLELTEDAFVNLMELVGGFAQSACKNVHLRSAEGYALEVYAPDTSENNQKVFSLSSDWLNLLRHVKNKFRGRTNFSRTTHL